MLLAHYLNCGMWGLSHIEANGIVVSYPTKYLTRELLALIIITYHIFIVCRSLFVLAS